MSVSAESIKNLLEHSLMTAALKHKNSNNRKKIEKEWRQNEKDDVEDGPTFEAEIEVGLKETSSSSSKANILKRLNHTKHGIVVNRTL